MSRTATSLTTCVFLLFFLNGCEQAGNGATTAAQPAQTNPAPTPAAITSSDISVEPVNSSEGGSSTAGISADAIARAQAAGAGAGYGAPQVDLSEVNAAIDRVQRANQAMRSGGAPATPAPAAPAPPAGLPPAQVKITGDTIVPSAPELAGDVINGIRRVYAAQTGCTTIDGIDTKAVSAVGPFNKNPQGRLISGTIIERWSVQGCGKTAAYHVAMKVLSDSTVDYAITGA